MFSFNGYYAGLLSVAILISNCTSAPITILTSLESSPDVSQLLNESTSQSTEYLDYESLDTGPYIAGTTIALLVGLAIILASVAVGASWYAYENFVQNFEKKLLHQNLEHEIAAEKIRSEGVEINAMLMEGFIRKMVESEFKDDFHAFNSEEAFGEVQMNDDYRDTGDVNDPDMVENQKVPDIQIDEIGDHYYLFEDDIPEDYNSAVPISIHSFALFSSMVMKVIIF